jgi:phage tail sheath protein FI
MDIGGKTDSVATVVDRAKTLDSSYAAAYWPWVKIYDDENSKNVWVPPSVVLGGVIAYTDKVAHEWFAPAGLNRGGLPDVLQAYDRFDTDDKNDLYLGRLNPIVNFPGIGLAVWGQKTLQGAASALDRVNVRRLMIKLKKSVASIGQYYAFEQSEETTWSRLKRQIEPIMDGILANKGFNSYGVVIDDSTNTDDSKARNEIRGELYIEPTTTGEFIVFGFNILPQGTSFTG